MKLSTAIVILKRFKPLYIYEKEERLRASIGTIKQSVGNSIEKRVTYTLLDLIFFSIE